MKEILLILGFLLMAGNAQAHGQLTAGKLVTWCESDDSFKLSFCMGYLLGFWEMFQAEEVDNNRYYLKEGITDQFKKRRKNCVPLSLSNNQIRKVFLKYAHEKPEQLDYPALMLVNNSIIDAWPCKKNK